MSTRTETQPPVERWRELLAAERDAAALYSRLAEAKTGERAQVFRDLAAIERTHAAHWESKLRSAGAVVPAPGRPSLRTRLLGAAAGRLSVRAVLPLIERAERGDAGVYDADPDALPYLVGSGTAALGAAIGLALAAMFGVGATIEALNGRSAVKMGLRQMLIGALAPRSPTESATSSALTYPDRLRLLEEAATRSTRRRHGLGVRRGHAGRGRPRLLADVAGEVQAEQSVGCREGFELRTVRHVRVIGERLEHPQRRRRVKVVAERLHHRVRVSP